MLILGFETSCDETSAAVLETDAEAGSPPTRLFVRSNVVSSQVPIHRKYGGVVPELASRAHLESVIPVAELALTRAGIGLSDINAVAVTKGPGLIGALMVGVQAAKSIAWAHSIPLLGVDHVMAHIAAVNLSDERLPLAPTVGYPHVALAVSGGHSAIYRVDAPGHAVLLGQTLDDAAGEAFDKVATLLGLGYPGGQVIDNLALTGDPDAIKFPRAWLGKRRHDFSFSGLKTSVKNYVRSTGMPEGQALNDLCASFQEAVVHVLVRKTLRAARELGVQDVVVAGGVAANSRLRARFIERAAKHRLRVYPCPIRFCSDNAAMIAGLGAIRWGEGAEAAPLTLDASARLPVTRA
ncbi:MAG: N6-L-threonylcarbamoyladenine synthase [Myxococcota bacterium]|jgi:N6-L-threonylcarbamoyladenine synthase